LALHCLVFKVRDPLPSGDSLYSLAHTGDGVNRSDLAIRYGRRRCGPAVNRRMTSLSETGGFRQHPISGAAPTGLPDCLRSVAALAILRRAPPFGQHPRGRFAAEKMFWRRVPRTSPGRAPAPERGKGERTYVCNRLVGSPMAPAFCTGAGRFTRRSTHRVAARAVPARAATCSNQCNHRVSRGAD